MVMNKPTAKQFWRWITGLALAVVVLGVVVGYAIRQRIPLELMADLRAGIAARHEGDPARRLHRYLENRYGSQDDPANRDKVFVDFFNVEHIKALQLMVRHSPESQRQASIDSMADWVAAYRQSLSEADRARLKEQFATPEGRAMLKQATSQYNQQDVEYRGQTASVISELLKTIHSLQNP